ncbi:Ldh family oxidoreductase [Polaromonas sp. AET17H-212]|uniref:Ldh family oxidoreductase n=1 Tax=Polaromonas sp. AET17H-212 TaxID=1977061 RepID=UPI000BBC3568
MAASTAKALVRAEAHGRADGAATTDPTAGLAGAMLALIVELLVTALLGAQFGFEASSFFVDEGNAPRLGQAFVVINPGALAGQDVYCERMETLITEMLVDNGVRLAGARRIALEQQAGQSGLTIPDALDEQLHRLAKMQ